MIILIKEDSLVFKNPPIEVVNNIHLKGYEVVEVPKGFEVKGKKEYLFNLLYELSKDFDIDLI